MAHECEDCGASFETLSGLRLHDCSDTDTTTGTPGTDSDQSSRDDETTSVPELDDQLDRVDDGDTGAVHAAVATFESALESALAADDGGDRYRDVFWEYYEPVSHALDGATRTEGWALLGDVVDAYDPAADDDVPLVTPAVANAVGRHVIRTRVTDGVEAVPVAALGYLDAVAVEAGDGDDVAREETHAYGWGIGHPDHPVVDRLRERAADDVVSVNPVLEHAFYADQHAAIDALERFVRDDPVEGALSRPGRADLPHRRYLLDCVYGLETDDHWPTTPRYWNFQEELGYTFELDASVERRIRDLVAETGFDADLPEDWTLRDLGV